MRDETTRKNIPTVMIIVLVIAIIVFFIVSMKIDFWSDSNETGKYKNYSDFEKSTSHLEGKVIKAEKDERFLQSPIYDLTVKNQKEVSKIVRANEEQFRNYQKGARISFRIDEKDENKVVIDLKKDDDINNIKEYRKKYKPKNNGMNLIL